MPPSLSLTRLCRLKDGIQKADTHIQASSLIPFPDGRSTASHLQSAGVSKRELIAETKLARKGKNKPRRKRAVIVREETLADVLAPLHIPHNMAHMPTGLFHRGRLSRRHADCAAIFVHAGAGYHSITNESVHLQACEDAARAGMAMLRAGGSAIDAVEIAIKVLEDREITNAGYGSNLAIDGVVEGDAVVVDHLGRSGGVGAVAQIKNPISLARHILDLSTQELSLRRVPPNLLVGQGATDFAHDQGIPVLPHDVLISPAAKERWLRWKEDLRNAEKRRRQSLQSQQTPSPPRMSPDLLPTYDEHMRRDLKREHAKAAKTAVWNEGQPISPMPTAEPRLLDSGVSSASRDSSMESGITLETPHTDVTDTEEGGLRQARRSPTFSRRRTHGAQDAALDQDEHMSDQWEDRLDTGLSDIDDSDDIMAEYNERRVRRYDEQSWHDGDGCDDTRSTSSSSTLRLPSLTPSPESSPQQYRQAHDEPLRPAFGPERPPTTPKAYSPSNQPFNRLDSVTDTVGAIAIDSDGNIACGASSGGIGMKFRGRIGPAALVGVGAAVVPVDPEDKSRTCTGAVTSGTGEHMATTLAASVCSERLYHSVKKRRGGAGFESVEEDGAVRAMIENDFMDHPSVKNSHSTGAIGILAVKKTAHGAYLYFAHNTDSFALASMGAEDPKPTCTMSRSHGNGMVATGGRSIKFRKR